MPSRSAASASRAWSEPTLAPVILVRGPEEVLRERAVAGILALAVERDPNVERVVLDGPMYASPGLQVAVSPSLFGEAKVVVITGAEECTDALISDVVAYLDRPDPDAVVVVVHGGGVRGKRMVDAVTKSGAPVLACDEIKNDGAKAQFVTVDLRAAGRRAEPEAVRALVEAVGSDLRELASAVSQLVADTTGTITAAAVDRYHGGRVEATGFRVADAAVAGDTGTAIALLRHALATGVDPVPLVAVLAMKLRQLAKAAATRELGLSAREVGLQPWQLQNALKDLNRWTPDRLAASIQAVAQADVDVKGGSRDPVYAVERAVLTIAGSAAHPRRP